MNDKRAKAIRNLKIFCVGLGIESTVLAVMMVVLLANANWAIFAVQPPWLIFVLLIVFGVSLIALSLNLSRISSLKVEMENAVVCPSCGEECQKENAFCPHCGQKLIDEQSNNE
ncbi:MAG: zinc-ribbon domain-containing protein [Clostridia bacterium]|nr:zinc-ribbon domain-containing protein [Clostridia bacterium]